MRGVAFLCSVAFLGSAATAAQLPLAQDAADFGVRESVSTVDLSPSGTQIAYIAPAANGATVAVVADVAGKMVRPVIKAAGGAERLSWCRFVTDSRMICGYSAVLKQYDMLIPYTRLVAINTDGSAVKPLGQSSSFYDSRLRQFDGSVLDWLPGGGGDVLLSREYVPETGRTAQSHISRNEDGLGVDRVNTLTLAAKPVEAARRGVSDYLSDGQGNVRLMIFEEDNGSGKLTGRTKTNYRTAGSREWRTLVDYGGEEITPLAIDGQSDALYALKKKDGRDALYRIRLTNPPVTELVGEHPRVDIDGVIRSANGQHVIGYTFVDDVRETVYFDPEYKALHAMLGRALPKLPLIRFAGASADGNRVLVYAGSDSDPGRYFIFEKGSKRLNEIFLVRPQLEKRALAPVKTVSVKVTDGTLVPAYLTLPVGKDAKALPAVVLPHGGPSARDEWGFDWLAQFLAARGYAVIQPNYRGSAGFGDHWLLENGFKSWKTSVGDITGSIRWLVDQGIADPNRLAIVGWSYGGYAALQAAATDPSLFKSVVAIAPVTDLAMWRDELENFTSANIRREFVGSGPHIAEGSPLRLADRIKAPVLLAHGDMDRNVGVNQSLRMEQALRANGTAVELLRYPSLDHQLEDSQARREMLVRIGGLLERTIGQ